MVAIKKTGEGMYEASFQKTVSTIDKHSGYQLKKEVGKIISSNRIITIDLKQADNMDNNGYKMLEQLVELAGKKSCKLSFKNPGPNITKKIQIFK